MNISFILPVYNTDYQILKKSMDSISRSLESKDEVIIVDDGSTSKGTIDFIKKLSNYDRRIRTIRQNNHGQDFSRMAGVQLANNEYVCFVDADDTLISKNFSKIRSQAYFKFDLLVFDFNVASEKDSKSSYKKIFSYDKTTKIKTNEYWSSLLCGDLLNPMWGKIYRKKIINTKLQSRRVTLGEDRIRNVSFIGNISTIFYVPISGYLYTANNSGVTAKIKPSYIDDLLLVSEFDLEAIGSSKFELLNYLLSHGNNCFRELASLTYKTSKKKKEFLDKREKIFSSSLYKTLRDNRVCKRFPVKTKALYFCLKHKIFYIPKILLKIFH